MAVVTIPEEDRTIKFSDEISRFLSRYGIDYQRWPLEDRVDPDASPEVILEAYREELQQLMAAGNYVTADVISVNPKTPGLQAMLDKFNREHTHTEDEVRFILKGRGISHLHPDKAPVFTIQTEAGDMISVPAGTRHWFNLCDELTIRAIRLFQDTSGWTPHYVGGGIHLRYQPVCWGPQFVPPKQTFNSSIEV